MLRPLISFLVALHAFTTLATASSVAAESNTLFSSRGNHKMPSFEETSDDVNEYEVEFDLDVHSTRKIKENPLFSMLKQGKEMNYGRGWSYHTTESIETGELLVSMPMSHVMSLESARKGRIGVLLEANPDLPPAIALALHVLEEKYRGIESPYASFIASMPSLMEINSTMFYSDSELELLQGSNLFRVTKGRMDAIQNFYEALVTPLTSLAVNPPLFSTTEFTLDQFQWAMGIVWSYAFPLSESEDSVVLAPILSTIGICTDPTTCPRSNGVQMDTSEQRLVVYATQEYTKGQQVLLPLGGTPPSTTLYMLNHGFAPLKPLKEVETYEISIFLDSNDPLIAVKTHLLENNNMSMNSTYTLRYQSTFLDINMIKSLKMKLLTGSELDKINELVGETKEKEQKEDHVVSLRNEFVFTRAILLSCRRLLEQYPTTLEQDRSALQARIEADATNGMMDRSVHILRALIVEKEILHHSIDLVTKQWTDLLTSDHPNLVKSG